jgi:hypothetical protein
MDLIQLHELTLFPELLAQLRTMTWARSLSSFEASSAHQSSVCNYAASLEPLAVYKP